ncbi:type VII secretion protein EccE [Jatrophihabitans sp. YIM 134969]
MTTTSTDRGGDVRTVEGTATSRVVRTGAGRRRRDPDVPRSRRGRAATPKPRTHRRWLVRLAVLEIAAVAVLATLWPLQPVRPLQVTVGALALVAVLATWIRRRGRSLDQWAARAVTFRWRAMRRGRTERRASGAGDESTLDALDPALLGLGLSGLAVRAHVDRAGNRAGVVVLGDDGTDSVSGVVRVAAGVDPEPSRLLRGLRSTFERADIPLAAAQVVVWSVPGPARDSVLRVHWLAVRYLPAAAPAAANARGGGLPGAIRATAMAALGLARDLTEAGVPAAPLGVRELRGELGVAVGLDPLVLTGAEAAPPAHEGWRAWSAGAIHQVTLRPARAGGIEDHLGLLRAHAPGAAFTCVSTTLRRDLYGAVEEEVLVRVGVPVETGRTDVRSALDTAVGRLDAGLVPVVGEQARGVRCTLPLAL